jgi:predicted CoA-binding protein
MAEKTVAVLGASNNPDRYSNKAVKLLLEHKYNVIPVNPKLDFIEGIKVVKTLGDIKKPVYTLSLYIGPERITPLIPDILNLKPQRVILNPGTESAELTNALKKANIAYLEACTLVLLNTGQFEKAV